MNAIDTAKHYFQLSNNSDFESISELFSDQAEYRSQNTGDFVGREDIIAMQKEFHGKFKSKNWDAKVFKEINPNTVVVDYDFEGLTLQGDTKKSTGLEYIYVKNGLITKVEIRSKD